LAISETPEKGAWRRPYAAWRARGNGSSEKPLGALAELKSMQTRPKTPLIQAYAGRLL
jgi:hypothetical protein